LLTSAGTVERVYNTGMMSHFTGQLIDIGSGTVFRVEGVLDSPEREVQGGLIHLAEVHAHSVEEGGLYKLVLDDGPGAWVRALELERWFEADGIVAEFLLEGPWA